MKHGDISEYSWYWLVVWNMKGLFVHRLEVIIPTDELIFFQSQRRLSASMRAPRQVMTGWWVWAPARQIGRAGSMPARATAHATWRRRRRYRRDATPTACSSLLAPGSAGWHRVAFCLHREGPSRAVLRAAAGSGYPGGGGHIAGDAILQAALCVLLLAPLFVR